MLIVNTKDLDKMHFVPKNQIWSQIQFAPEILEQPEFASRDTQSVDGLS